MIPVVQSTERMEKLRDIAIAVLEEVTDSCADCGITNDIIDKQSFSCFPESPTYVTYRARLEGTSETNSSSLISLIEEWVSSGASIIVTGVLMTVDSECSVAISSLSEGECEAPTSDHTSSSMTTYTTIPTTGSFCSCPDTGAIIAGVVAIILTLSITINIVAIVALVIVKYRYNLSTKK